VKTKGATTKSEIKRTSLVRGISIRTISEFRCRNRIIRRHNHHESSVRLFGGSVAILCVFRKTIDFGRGISNSKSSQPSSTMLLSTVVRELERVEPSTTSSYLKQLKGSAELLSTRFDARIPLRSTSFLLDCYD
jgi:hypothetical protein